MTAQEFISHIEKTVMVVRPAEWHYGQYAFNELYRIKPDVANKIRTTRLDPFHWKPNQWRMREQFYNRLVEIWDAS